MQDYNSNSIHIRRFQTDDTKFLYEAVRESIPEISRWLSWCTSGYSIEDSADWVNSRDDAWKRGEEFSFVIEHEPTKMIQGGVGINQINRVHQFGNLGYWVRTGQAGKGIATVAAIWMARFGFRELKLKRIEILTDVRNLASQRVAEKTGAKREGILRNRLLFHDQAFDAVLYSLVAADFADYQDF